MEPYGLVTLGERLTRVRQEVLRETVRGMERWLAEQGNDTSHTSLLRYESNDRLPDAEFLRVLVEKAEISAHWLLTGEGPMRSTDPDRAAWLLERVGKIVDEARQIIPANPAMYRLLPDPRLEDKSTDPEGG